MRTYILRAARTKNTQYLRFTHTLPLWSSLGSTYCEYRWPRHPQGNFSETSSWYYYYSSLILMRTSSSMLHIVHSRVTPITQQVPVVLRITLRLHDEYVPFPMWVCDGKVSFEVTRNWSEWPCRMRSTSDCELGAVKIVWFRRDIRWRHRHV